MVCHEDVLCVARAGFDAWLHNPVSARDKDNQRLLTRIRDSCSLSGGVYGYRRVHGDLNEIGEICGKNRVGRIMQLNQIKALRSYKAPRRIAGRPSVVAPNRVQRQFTVVRANQVCVTDIGVLRRNRRNFRYLSFSPATSASRSIISLLLWKV
ncbi:HTH-like domain-containing protein [Klebsiella pneumoniae]